MKYLSIVFLAAVSTNALAIDPCYQEPGTRSMLCIDGKNVHSNGDLRSSYVFQGGPNGVKKLPYRIIANCTRKIATLQDAQGVNFGGGKFDATPQMAALGGWLCEAQKTKPDKHLQQF